MYSTAVSKCDPLTSNTVAVTKQKLIIINTFDRSLFFFLRRCTVDDWFAKDHKVSRVEWVRRTFLSRRKCSQHYRCRILDEKGQGKKSRRIENEDKKRCQTIFCLSPVIRSVLCAFCGRNLLLFSLSAFASLCTEDKKWINFLPYRTAYFFIMVPRDVNAFNYLLKLT